MLKVKCVALLCVFGYASLSQAGVVIGGTRLIYDGSQKESSLSVKNPDKTPYLIQSWVDKEKGSQPPFVITPPLFRLDSGQENRLRIVSIGKQLPQSHESLFWMNIKAIPSVEKTESANTLQIAIKTRIKLIYRPASVTGVPEEMADKLKWSIKNNRLDIYNPTPFVMNFHSITLGGQKLKDVTYVLPNGHVSFVLPPNRRGHSVSWSLINDQGGKGIVHENAL